MALIFNDTFTDTSGTVLSSHTPDLGTGWTRQSGTATLAISNANRCRVGTVSGGFDGTLYTAGATYPNDYEIRAIVRFLSAESNFIRLVGRWTAGNGFALEWFQSGGTLRIIGLGTTSTTVVPSLNTDYDLRLRMVGTAISVTLDGVSQLSVTDNTYTSGVAGLFLQDESASPSNSNGVHVDTFSVDDLAAASVAFRPYYITG